MTWIGTIRPWRRSDDDALRCVLEAQMQTDPGWPPGYARGGDIAAWLGEPASLGRWVAVSPGDRIVGHVGIAPVQPGPMADLWLDALGCGLEDIAEICRLIVDATVQRHGVSGHLTRHAVRACVEAGRVPVAYALQSRTASIAMMVALGWRAVANTRSPRTGGEIVILIPPPKLVHAARSATTGSNSKAAP